LELVKIHVVYTILSILSMHVPAWMCLDLS
jgi:hypothetical protein